MKLMMGRKRNLFGGTFRRFREMAAWCQGRAELIGLLPMGDRTELLDWPARTYSYSEQLVPGDIWDESQIGRILDRAGPLIERIRRDIEREKPDAILSVDTDFRSLSIIAAAQRAGHRVTTVVAGLSTIEDSFEQAGTPPFTVAVERFCLLESNALVFPSGLARAECLHRYPDLPASHVIWNAIPGEMARWPASRSPERKVGGVMRLAAVKNPAGFFDLCDKLAHHGFAADLIAPPSPDYAIPEAIRLLAPRTSTSDLAAFYQSCAAVVSLSRFETFGNVPLEAVALGVPAVVSNRMGVAEVFEDAGLREWVVAPDDLDGAAQRVREARGVPEHVRRQILNLNSWESCGTRLLQAASGR